MTIPQPSAEAAHTRWVGFPDFGRLSAILPAGQPGIVCTFRDAPDNDDACLMLAAPELYEIVTLGARVFRQYESIHRAKGTSDGHEKAEANRMLAEQFEAAILKAQGRSAQEKQP